MDIERSGLTRFSLAEAAHFLGRRCLRWVATGVIAGLLLLGVEYVFAHSLQSVLHLLTGATGYSVTFICATLLAASIARGALQFVALQSATLVHEQIVAKGRLAIFEFFFGGESGVPELSRINAMMSEVFSRSATFVYNSSLILSYLVQAVGILALLLFMSPLLSVGALFTIGLAGLAVLSLNRTARQLSVRLVPLASGIQARLTHVVHNWFLVRAMRLERKEKAELSQMVTDYGAISIRTNALANLNAAFPSALGGVVIVSLVFTQLRWNAISGTDFLAFLYLFVRLVQCLSQLASCAGQIGNTLPAFGLAVEFAGKFPKSSLQGFDRRIAALGMLGRLSSPRSDEDRGGHAGSEPSPPRLELAGLGFRYAPDAPWVFRGLNVTLEPGKVLGIAGPSGSGKSTLLALLLGLLKPREGTVAVAGRAPDEYFASAPSVGYVGADPYLRKGTVRENLTYGLDKNAVSDEELWEALRLAEADGFLKERGVGLDFKIAESAEGLSSGQRQRLALARAWVRRPDFLILDEFTSNLDGATEGVLMQNLARFKGRVSVVMVTHKRELLKVADHVLDFTAHDREGGA